MANANTFAPDDVVKLKSSSTKMTVESVSGPDCVCVWIDDSKKPQREAYAAVLLQKWKPNVPRVF